MLGKVLIQPDSSFTTNEGLLILHTLGRKSPDHDVAKELKAKYPKLYEHEAILPQLKVMGHTGLTVLVGLEEEDD